MEEGVPIESRFVSKQIENAQKRVEGQNFGYRKHVLEYDDVMNKQREAVYGLRRQLLEGEDQKEYLMGIADDIMIDLVSKHAPKTRIPTNGTLMAANGGPAAVRFRSSRGRYRSQTARLQATRRSAPREGSRKVRQKEEHHRRCNALSRAHAHVANRGLALEGSPALRWTTSRKASACAATASAIRWSNTRRNRSSCSKI
jgi:preprotein translocase subunit SecA